MWSSQASRGAGALPVEQSSVPRNKVKHGRARGNSGHHLGQTSSQSRSCRIGDRSPIHVWTCR
eukprot:6619600-Alexandrium_andersonii.AAC.1